jgi:hypothetical protein
MNSHEFLDISNHDETDDIDYYFKEIGKGRKAVDYDKVDSVDFPINIIITERKVRVKTFGAKEHLYKKFALSNGREKGL